MIVPLLPVFLVANLTVNEKDWKYGPEVIYDASMNGTRYQMINGMEKIFVHNTTMKIMCRPKNQTAFRCHFHDPRTVISLIEPNGNHRIINDSKIFNDKYSSNANYLFDFNAAPDNLDDNYIYTVSSSISSPRLDLVRSFMDTLNAPACLPKLRRGQVEITENSTVGIRCKTKYFVTPVNFLANSPSLNANKAYKIFIASGPKLSEKEGILISRTRMPLECYALMMGFLDDNYNDDNYRTSSKTDMIMAENMFVSNDQATLILQDLKTKPTRPSATEFIRLSLENILPANGPLPIIRDPMDFRSAGTRVFHSQSAAEWLFTKERL